MLEIYELLKQNGFKATSYQKLGNAILVITKQGKKVVKKNTNLDIYNYLNSRSFNYYPKSIISNNYEIMNYIDEINMPSEQKIHDMVKLVALLHSKTTYYKEANDDTYKKIYENLTDEISKLSDYYHDVITKIDEKIYMSPSEYLLALGISKIFNSLAFCKKELDSWYNLVKDKKKQRFVVIHNNLELNHFLRSDEPYLISWGKAKSDLPLFDLYALYKKHGLEYDFDSLLKLYEKEYPLLDDEKKLLFILISLPNKKINWNLREYDLCKEISQLLDYLYKTDNLISPYYSNNTIENKTNKQE